MNKNPLLKIILFSLSFLSLQLLSVYAEDDNLTNKAIFLYIGPESPVKDLDLLLDKLDIKLENSYQGNKPLEGYDQVMKFLGYSTKESTLKITYKLTGESANFRLNSIKENLKKHKFKIPYGAGKYPTRHPRPYPTRHPRPIPRPDDWKKWEKPKDMFGISLIMVPEIGFPLPDSYDDEAETEPTIWIIFIGKADSMQG